ncbi:hypothetical protein EDB86DRAFT_2830106 [Lactarius hatsudake]|nr:hypothetical protein EDB86DRAFT_2830106 [Lactarius hatsudake]
MGSSTSNTSKGKDLLDLHGRVAIVHGCKLPLRIVALKSVLYIVLHLVLRGAKVYPTARSEEKAANAIARMEKEGLGEHPGELAWLPIDLTNPHQAKAAAEWFIKREQVGHTLSRKSESLEAHIARSMSLLTHDLVDFLLLFGGIYWESHQPVLVHEDAFGYGKDRVEARIRRADRKLSHRWVPKPRYDSLEVSNNDFTNTWRPKLDVYCKGLFTLTFYGKLWTNELQRRFDAEKILIMAVFVRPGKVMSDWSFSLVFISPHDDGYTLAWAAAARQVFEERD